MSACFQKSLENKRNNSEKIISQAISGIDIRPISVLTGVVRINSIGARKKTVNSPNPPIKSDG